MEELCTTLANSTVGQVALTALGGLAASGTLAQVDAWIPEKAKQRLGKLQKIIAAVAGNYGESKNAPSASPAAPGK